MKEKLLKKNIVIMDKITGKKFLVRDVEKDIFSISLLNDDGTEAMPGRSERVEKKDLILYRFVRDVQEPKLPSVADYAIKNGILVKDGVQLTEQGVFVFAKILGAIKNCLLLMTNNWDIVLYNLRKDMFKKLMISPASSQGNIKSTFMVAQESGPFLAYSNVWDVVTGDADEEKEVYKESVILAENKAGVIVKQAFFGGEIKDIFVTNGYLVISYITADGKEMSVVSDDDDLDSEALLLRFDGKVVRVQSINEYVTVQLENGDINVLTPDGDPENPCGYNLPELDGFSAVDADQEGMYFVNSNRKIKKVIATNTRDRGTIYSVEAVN